MHRVWLAVLVVVPAVASAQAPAGARFGGFSPDGARYLVGRDQVCAPLVVARDGAATGRPRCERVTDRKALREHAFERKRRGARAPDGRRLDAAVARITRLHVTAAADRGDEQVLVRWDRRQPITAVRALHVSSDGRTIAVEYTYKGLGGTTRADVVAFRLGDARASRPGARPEPAPGRPPSAGKPAPTPGGGPAPGAPRGDRTGNAYARAVAHGGVWEQRLVACDEAGVTLRLAKDRKFGIRIETRCHGDKSVTELDGTWVPEGSDRVVLTFANEDGPQEALPCRLARCEVTAEDCLTCEDEDVRFVLEVVRR